MQAAALSTRPVDNIVHEGVRQAFHACSARASGNMAKKCPCIILIEINHLNVEQPDIRESLPKWLLAGMPFGVL